MAADNTRKTSNVIHDLATLKTQVDKNTNDISNAVSPKDGKINLSVGTGLSLADGSANASANQESNTQWTINLDPDNIVAKKYVKTIDGVGPNSTTGDVDLKSTDDSLKVTPDATNNSIDLTLNTTIPTVNDKTIGLAQGTGINITGDNATTNMDANSSQTITLNASLNDLNNVNTTSASKDQALVYNGTEWVPGTVSGGDGTVKKVGGVGPNTTTGDVSLKSDGNTLTITPDTANNTVKLEANLATLNSSLSSTLPFVKIDGTSKMTGNLQTPGIQGTQTRDANEDPNKPISFTEVIEGGADGGDASDDYTQWLCSGHIYMGYTGSDPDSQTYRIKNLQEPVDDHDAATKQYVDGKTANIPTNVVNKLNTKTGEITIKSDDSNTIGVDTSDQNITLNLSANLGQLKDVNSTAASPNQVLTWDDSAKEWKPAASQTGGVTELSALNDTNIDDPETGEILVYDKVSGKWNNQSPGENTAELPISSSDDTVKLSDDTVGGKNSNFIVETGTDVFKLVANASVFGTDTNPNGGPEVISIVGDGWGGIIVGDSVTGNRIPDGTVVVSKDPSNNRVTLSQDTTGDTLSTEELTFSHPAPAAAQFQERMRIDGIGQITAETPGYDENVQATSLVTKAWVEANSGSGGVSNLPIASVDNTVEVYQPLLNEGTAEEAPHVNHFAVRTGTNERTISANGGNVGINKQYTRSAGVSQQAEADRNNYVGWSQQLYINAAVDPDANGNRQVYGQRVTPTNVVPTDVDLILYDNGQIGTSNGVKSVEVFRVNDDDNDAVSMKGFVSTVALREGFTRYNIDVTGSAPSRFEGQIQTDTITTKDAVDGDASIALADGAVYVAGTDINESESPKLYFRGHTSTASSVANLGYIQATVEDGSSYKGILGFWSAIGGAPYYRDEPDFSINSVGQLHASTDYVPSDDNSLVTKKYVTNTDGGIGTLPISSSDGSVTLQSPSQDKFEIETSSGSTYDSYKRFTIDDESTTILPKDPILSTINDETITNALRLYTDASKNYIGFGITQATFNISACGAVANIDVWAKSTKAARFTEAGIFLYSDSTERFRLRGDGTIGIGDSTIGARSQGIRCVYNDIVSVNNWISLYDSTEIPEPVALPNPDYIPPDDPENPRPDDYDPDTPELLAPQQVVQSAYGHWVQPRIKDNTGESNYTSFIAVQPVQVVYGTSYFKQFTGFKAENSTIAKNAVSFHSEQNVRGSILEQGYSFYASGNAPARFNGDVQTNTISSQADAINDGDIQLGNNVQLTTRSDTGVIKFAKSGSSNDVNYTLTQHGGSWNSSGVFGGGYQWQAQNAWYATDWWPQEGAVAGRCFQTVYGGNRPDARIMGTSILSLGPQRTGYLHSYPPVPSGTRFNVDDMITVLSWDHSQGHVGFNTSANTEAQMIVSSQSIFGARFTTDLVTGLIDYPHLQQAYSGTANAGTVGKKFLDSHDRNVYEVVVNDDYDPDAVEPTAPPRPNEEDFPDDDAGYNQALADYKVAYSAYKAAHDEWVYTVKEYKFVIPNLSEKDIDGNFVHQIPSGRTCSAVRAQSTLGMDAHSNSTVCVYYADLPAFSAAPQANPNWTFGGYASYFAASSTAESSPQAKLWSTGFGTNQNTIAGQDNVYSFYAIGTAPARFNGGIRTDTITTKTDSEKDISISLGGQFMYVESGDDNVYTFNSSNHFIVGSKDSHVNANRAGIEIHDTANPEMIFSMDADASAAETVALRRDGSSFYINAQTVGDDVKIATGNVVRLTVSDNDIAAFNGYNPPSDDSLVTKKYTDSRIWKGTQSEYDALSSYDDEILYCITG